MKNVITRSLTGVMYIAIIVGAIICGGWWFWGLATLFGVLGVNEFNRISNQAHVSNTTTLLDIIGAVLMISAAASPFLSTANGHIFASWSLATFIFAYLIYMLARFVSQLYIQDGNALQHYANSMLGQMYVAMPMALMCVLYGIGGKYLVLGMFIMIWLSDTGAFCVGSLLGRHKLFERISPKKSWEGFFGGLAFCLIAGAVYHYLFPELISGNLWQLMGLGAVVCVFGTWGDLVESLIKRTLGVKDSGNILPGHGGILDRIDSLLLVVPATVAYQFLIWL